MAEVREPRVKPAQRPWLEEAGEQGFLRVEDSQGRVTAAWRVRCWKSGTSCAVVEGVGPEVRVRFWLPPVRRLTREAPWAFMAESGASGRVVSSYSPFGMVLQTRVEHVLDALADLNRLVEDCATDKGRAALRKKASALGRADDDTEGVRESVFRERDPARNRPVREAEYPLFAAALEGMIGPGAAESHPVLANLHFLGGVREDPWAWLQVAGPLPVWRHLAAGRPPWRMDPKVSGLRVVEHPASGPGPVAISFSSAGYRPGMRRALLEVHRHPDGDFLTERNASAPTDRFPEIVVLSRRPAGWQVLERQLWIPANLE